MNAAPNSAIHDIDILIQGAGIGGLTLAIALVQRGYSVHLVEKSPSLSEIGAGIWMAANPMQVFERLGFAGKITAAGWPVHRMLLKDYSGDILQTTDLSAVSQRFGHETVAIHRSILQRLLFSELPPKTVTFNTSVQSVKPTQIQPTQEALPIQLTNGTTLKAKLLVGADGIHSQIRQLIFPGSKSVSNQSEHKEIRYSGTSSYRAIARHAHPMPVERDHDAYEIWAKGCRLGFSKINEHDFYWYMTFDSPPNTRSTPEERKNHAASLFRAYFPQWIALLKTTHPDEILQTDLTDLKRLPKWSSGRIGLIGDAAHATTPNLGQGGAMAIEDAFTLTNALQKTGLNPSAFALYETQRRKKVDWTVSTSWSIGKICHYKNPIARYLRNTILKRVLSSQSDSQLDKIYSIQG